MSLLLALTSSGGGVSGSAAGTQTTATGAATGFLSYTGSGAGTQTIATGAASGTVTIIFSGNASGTQTVATGSAVGTVSGGTIVYGGAGGGPAKKHKGHVKPKHIYPEKKLTYDDLVKREVTIAPKELVHPKTLVVKTIKAPANMTEEEEFLMIMNELDML